jgi:hypothetical protein
MRNQGGQLPSADHMPLLPRFVAAAAAPVSWSTGDRGPSHQPARRTAATCELVAATANVEERHTAAGAEAACRRGTTATNGDGTRRRSMACVTVTVALSCEPDDVSSTKAPRTGTEKQTLRVVQSTEENPRRLAPVVHREEEVAKSVARDLCQREEEPWRELRGGCI